MNVTSKASQNQTRQKEITKLGISVAAYFAFYFLVSLAGKYTEGPVASGESRIFNGAWAVRDQYVWEPKFFVHRPYEKNLFGFIYWPLIALDRKYWHKSIRISGQFITE